MSPRLILASNHGGAREWLFRVHKIRNVVEIPDLQPEDVSKGDHVIVGKTLPWPMLAAFSGACGQLFVLKTHARRGQRGRSLSYRELKANKAMLVPLTIAPTDWADQVTTRDEVILVTRHAGARTWLWRHFPGAPLVEHWEEADWQRVRRGHTTVAGMFPPEMVEYLCRKGGRFLALQFRIPLNAGKRELGEAEVEAHWPYLQGYTARFHEAMVCTACGADWIVPHSAPCPCCGGGVPYSAAALRKPFGRT